MKYKKETWYIVFTALTLSIVAIGITSVWRSIEPATSNAISQTVAATQSQLPQVEASNSTLQKTIKKTIKKTDISELNNEPIEDVVTQELSPSERLTNTLNTLRENISSDGLELLHPMVGVNEDYFGLRQDLLSAIGTDPLLLDTLIELFEQDPDSLLGRELAAVLAIVGSPKTQAIALDMATNSISYTDDERAAALMMVAEMDGITSVTRDRLLGNIEQEIKSELTQYSLMALRNAPSTAEDYVNVHRVLQETLQRDDENVRRHASYQIGEWATNNEDLAPLRTMALEEPDLNARARAVMSLGISDFRNTEDKITLYAVAENDENPLIRFEAWEALETFPLNDMEKANYSELGERIRLDIKAYEALMNAE